MEVVEGSDLITDLQFRWIRQPVLLFEAFANMPLSTKIKCA